MKGELSFLLHIFLNSDHRLIFVIKKIQIKLFKFIHAPIHEWSWGNITCKVMFVPDLEG